MKRENRLRRNNVILIIMPKTHPGFAVKKYSNFVVMMMMMIIIIKYSLLSQSQGLLVCSNRNRKSGGHQQGRDGLFVRTWKAHHTKYDDYRESAFLFQRLSVLIQRYNAVAVLGTFTHTTPEDELYSRSSISVFSLVFSSRDLYYRGPK